MPTNKEFHRAFLAYKERGAKWAWNKMLAMHNRCALAKKEYKDEYAELGFWFHEPEPEGWWDDWGNPADENQVNEADAR